MHEFDVHIELEDISEDTDRAVFVAVRDFLQSLQNLSIIHSVTIRDVAPFLPQLFPERQQATFVSFATGGYGRQISC